MHQYYHLALPLTGMVWPQSCLLLWNTSNTHDVVMLTTNSSTASTSFFLLFCCQCWHIKFGKYWLCSTLLLYVQSSQIMLFWICWYIFWGQGGSFHGSWINSASMIEEGFFAAKVECTYFDFKYQQNVFSARDAETLACVVHEICS